jgi:predicted amidophosphoribosyltransferase
MLCLVCQSVTRGSLCPGCRSTLKPAPDRLLAEGIRVIAAFEHDDAARVLIHHLKYRGITNYAELVADLLAPRLPALPLVPVPRALTRRVRYGVDGARVVATVLARRLRVPVVDALAAPLHAPRRAGRDHARGVPPYRLRSRVPTECLVVDDVVTTGGTILAAVAALGSARVRTAVTANLVPRASNVTSPSPQARMEGIWQLL